MVFSSLLFLFLFLPLCLLVNYIAKTNSSKNVVLLIFSLIFYAWTNPKYLILLIIMVFVNWVCGIKIEKQMIPSNKKIWLIIDLVISLGLLGIFKYLGFATEITHALFGIPNEVISIVLPIGISFYTFQLISYTIDVYREDVEAEKSFFGLLLYAGLFFQCIAGPIVRYRDVAEEIHYREVRESEVSYGISRFATGLAKKTLLANNCASLVATLIPADVSGIESSSALGLWLGALFYMFQIYLDFSAYSDMAIGMGLMVGFHFKENFNYPYICSSITDFWRRWHISLSSFFRDYVYIPLGGNRCGKARNIFNILVVWFLTGLWHGASVNFILWGLYFFVFLMIEKLFLLKIFKRIPKIIGHIYSLIVVYFGWILFYFTDMDCLKAMLKGMFLANGNAFTSFETGMVFLNNVFFFVICIIAVTPVVKALSYALSKNFQNKVFINIKGIAEAVIPIALLVLSTMALIGNSYNPFLYFQF